MKKSILNLLLALCASVQLMAQERTVTGKVVGEGGESIPGANVVVQGTSRGTVTDIDGNYRLEVTEGDVLTFSFIGYDARVIEVGSQSTIDVTLEIGSQQLEEVVVTAMGIARSSKSLTYARQAVDTEDMQKARTSNFLQGLSGKAAGVQVTNAMTNTGSNRVTIRGNSSLLGNNNPIYVIDGVVIDQSTGDQQAGSWGGADNYVPVDYGDPLSNINPDDIESIEVLKGGNATALYGSRASNGVILITTKRGETREGWGVSLNSNAMFQNPMQYPDHQYAYGTGNNGVITTNINNIDPETGLPIAVANGAFGSPLLGRFDVIAPNGEVSSYAPDRNNIRDMFQTGVTLTNSVSIDNATKQGTVRFGYTNTSGEWNFPGMDKINRNNFHLRVTRNLTKSLSMDAMMMYVNEKVENRIVENGSTQNPVHTYIFLQPDLGTDQLVPWKTEEGYENLPPGPAGPFRNPYWTIYENENGDRTNRIVGKWELKYNIMPGLNVIGRVGTDYRSLSGYKYDAPRGPLVRGDKDGRYLNWDRNISNWNFDAIATYNTTLDQLGLEIDATVGARQNTYLDSRRQAVNEQLLEVPGVVSISNNAGITEASESDGEWILNSIYGYLNVGYQGLVYLNGTITREWSSTLSEDNNDYLYPSIGASFIFSELIPQNPILSYGKLRGTYAITGRGTGPYQVNPFYVYVGNYQGNYPYVRTPGRLNNPFLRNEETEDIEVGLETRLFNNRVNANITYYKRDSYDQIVSGDVAAATGYGSIVANAGLITNKGWEVFLGAEVLNVPLMNKAFRWNVDINWSRNVNRVVHMKGTDAVGNPFEFESFTINNWAAASVQVQPGELYGNLVGIDVAKDEDGRPLITEAGRPVESPNQILGNFIPDWLGGIRNAWSWNGISITALLDIKVGGEVLAMTHGRSTQYGTSTTSLEGRDEWLMSSRILGENNNERSGIGVDGNAYNRWDRKQGAFFEGVQASADGESTGEPNDVYINPNTYSFLHWRLHYRSIFDASYVKLREMTVGYSLPKSLLSSTPFQAVNVSLVGRNLWNILQNTPEGIDPEANSTSGNGQGLEYASFLPTRSLGFNINVTF